MDEIKKITAIEKLAENYAKSGIFGQVRPEELFVKIHIGQSLGLDPATSLMGVYFFIQDGKLNIMMPARYWGAKIKGGGKYDYKVLESTEKLCRVAFYEKKEQGWELIGESVVTMEDMLKTSNVKTKDGGLKRNWKEHPKIMLFYRALSQGVSMFCPDVFYGLPVYNEADDWRSEEPKIRIDVTKVEKPEATQIEITKEEPISEAVKEKMWNLLGEWFDADTIEAIFERLKTREDAVQLMEYLGLTKRNNYEGNVKNIENVRYILEDGDEDFWVNRAYYNGGE